ncbi:unnamed protein product [Wickerhamomyces anomalus]
MSWLSFLKSKDFDPSSFEKELANISSKISKNQRSIGSFKYQERQSKSFIIIYGSLSYLFILLYFLIKNGLQLNLYHQKEIALIIGTPILLILATKTIIFYYAKRISRLESHIEHLKSQHESKIEELKNKTNFQSTQALLNRFTDGNDLNAQLDEELLAKQQQLEEIKKLSLEGNNEAQRFNAYSQAGSSGKRHWYDSIIDTVVGADELSPNNRFALICINCSSHNGLAPPGMKPEYVKYICPRCGVLNGKDPEPAPQVIVEDVDEETTNESKKEQ